MKKGMILILSVFFIGIASVSAASSCSYQEQADLNNIAANVKASYEVKTGISEPNTYALPDILIGTEEADSFKAEYKYFEVSILNIVEDVYVVVSNSNNDTKYTVHNADTTNEIYTIEWKDVSKISSITIEVYSSTKTACPNEKYRVLYLKLPKMNSNYLSPLCSGNEEFYLCKEFITFEEPDFNTFENKIKDYESGKIDSTGEEKSNISKLSGNKTILIVGGCIIILGVVSVIALRKKRRITDEKK